MQEFDIEELRETVGGQNLAEGAYLQTQSGQPGEITHLDDEIVEVDFNHRLAGEPREFEIEILDIN